MLTVVCRVQYELGRRSALGKPTVVNDTLCMVLQPSLLYVSQNTFQLSLSTQNETSSPIVTTNCYIFTSMKPGNQEG
jgi:hypothetical protein